MKRKIIWTILILIIVAVPVAYLYSNKSNENTQTPDRAVTLVERGNIIEKALAVGTIQPEFQVEVKSKVSGVVKEIFAQPGTYVRQGDPLIQVMPDPTPLEMADARRRVELAEIQVENISNELERQFQLKERGMISTRDYQETERNFNDSVIRLQMEREKLALLESGRVTIDGIEIESIIKAPISGYILDKMVNIGDPVVPLTSYQAGTALMNIADMSNLMFKGNVDEIDVGKLREGMEVEIKIGAIPGSIIKGKLTRISLKAIKEDNATVFPVEITITDSGSHILRAGYSANADVIIQRLEDVLVIPERLITFRESRAFVEVLIDDASQTIAEKEVITGSSNAITIEIKDGLQEGDKVLERPLRSLTL